MKLIVAGFPMILRWKNNGMEIKALYWSNSLTLDEVKRESGYCDSLQIWYPKNCDNGIYDKYGSLLTYIEKNGRWKGTSYSNIIDLSQKEEVIFHGIKKNRRYEIKRAKERDSLQVEFIDKVTDDSLNQYIEFYNQFANTKTGLSLEISKVKALVKEQKFVIAKVMTGDCVTLVIHGYIVDEQDKMAALFSSSSLFRSNRDQAALIGRANGFLHFSSMIYFKKKGYRTYDFGGIYLGDENKDLMNISRFKASFGGRIIEYNDGFIIPIKEIRNIQRNLNFLSRKLYGKKVIVWGAGAFGQYVLKELTTKMHVMINEIIDNGLSNKKNTYKTEAILENYEAEDTIILITMSEETFTRIKQQNNCKRFVETGNFIWIRNGD